MQIAISGNIGAGKTELTKLLSRHYGYRAIYGPSEENPYLNSFYVTLPISTAGRLTTSILPAG